jgi:glycosyltransferase involved in cell wall biosynthesis
VIALSRAVLFIAYDFPPAGGAGVQRSVKFAKYLPHFGWQPVVVTATPDSYPVLDNSLVTDVPPETPIYRVKGHDVNMLRPAFERRRLGKLVSAVNVALMLPDALLFWACQARAAVKNAVEEHHPLAVYSSSPPASAHRLALWAHRTFGLPWIADFRDPWSQNELYPYYPGYRSINGWQEQEVLRAANRIVAAGGPLAEMFQSISGRNPSDVVLIENGYDEEDVIVLPPPHTSRFTITYTGEFSRLRRPDAFVTAVDSLLADRRIAADEIRVLFAGKDTARYVPDRPPFEQLGYLNHDQLNDLRRDSDLLLLIHNDSPSARGNYGGKLYEYLASNRPTLAITGPGNVAAQLIERARAGAVARHDPAQIAGVLLEYYRAWKTGGATYEPDWEVIRHFTRRNLAGLLAQQLDRATAGG